MRALEQEDKYALSSENFGRLLGLGRVLRVAEQVNVYYDRGWRLAERAATFRVRFSRERLPLLEIKLPRARAEDGARVSDEYQFEFANWADALQFARNAIDVDTALPPDVGQDLVRLGVPDVTRVGWARTRRHRLRLDALGIECDLDEVTLPGGRVMYELEIEHPDAATRRTLAGWALEHAPGARRSADTKYQNFRAAAIDAASRGGANARAADALAGRAALRVGSLAAAILSLGAAETWHGVPGHALATSSPG